jgi:hypothetical protein
MGYISHATVAVLSARLKSGSHSITYPGALLLVPAWSRDSTLDSCIWFQSAAPAPRSKLLFRRVQLR